MSPYYNLPAIPTPDIFTSPVKSVSVGKRNAQSTTLHSATSTVITIVKVAEAETSSGPPNTQPSTSDRDPVSPTISSPPPKKKIKKEIVLIKGEKPEMGRLGYPGELPALLTS